MSVNLNAGPTYGYQLLPLFGVDMALAAKAAQTGVTVEQTQPGAFSVGYAGTTQAVVTVKSSAITLAKAGSLGPASAAAVKYQFEAALKKALAMVPAADMMKVTDPIPSSSDPLGIKEIAAVSIHNVLNDLHPGGVIDNSMIADATIDSSMAVVKLANASKLLQKVSGTSSGSLYTVIALYEGLAVAVRKKPATLSVRVEGKDLMLYQAQLSEVGLDNNGSYASAHFSVTTPAERMKVVGAILGMIGLGGKAKIAPLTSVL